MSVTMHIGDGQHCKVQFRDGSVTIGAARVEYTIDGEPYLAIADMILRDRYGVDNPLLERVVYPLAPKVAVPRREPAC